MKLIDIVNKKLFKCNIKTSVDYHANMFFVKKHVSYLFFHDLKCYIYSRKEGLHPNDNKYDILTHDLLNHNIKNVKEYEVFQLDSNINILNLISKENSYLCMPSIFTENLFGNISEIALDDRQNNIYIYIYNYVYTL